MISGTPTIKSKAVEAVLTHQIIAYTIINMKTELTWDEAKRQSNLIKHGLDFADAEEVLESIYRLDLLTGRNDKKRVQSISYALGFLAVVTVVHVKRDNSTRIISFRRGRQYRKRGLL
ncbi:BrnT family toxin [Crenothrix polyspora]|uniref:DUF4258 domain-containing protein n=1 Tax=Crenothrix polyspora TaxID=360316 RepID=A0A1R4H9U6_9GAMM|nr:BrnT family toxin [Crenothrix polyspora]SJM92993.1 hypothetical protein CRENPOLYSF1_360015 [Crenothrix polyspora]